MKNRIVASAVLVLALLAVGAGEASAAVRTYMLVPGIPGSAMDVDHPDWIEVVSLSQGAATSKKSLVCSDLSIMKQLDQAGPALWGAAAAGQVFPEVRIEVVGPGDAAPVIYDIRLGNAKVTSIQTSGSSELPFESVSFSYQFLTLTFNKQSSTGAIIPGTPQMITCQ